MRKVILQEFVTLNGLAAGPNDSVDFIPASTQGDQTFGQDQMELMKSIDTILLGRVTYQMFAGYWPTVTDGEDKDFAAKLNATPKVVFSRTLERAPWGGFESARIAKTPIDGEVAKLKRQTGKDMILWGSLSTAQSLVSAGLVDEFRLVVCPLVIAGGRPLFSGSSPIDLELVDAKKLDRGAVSLRYAPR
jgi:dihydrofolate reductase